MTRVNFLATEQHYADHLLPVYETLRADVRGRFYTDLQDFDPTALTVVSSYGDMKLTEGPVILFEHGVGLSYSNNHPSFAGGAGRERVVLFCTVNEYSGRRNAEAYPNTRQEIVGCPKLDFLANQVPATEPNTAAFSFHWNSKVAPETTWGFSHFMPYFKWAKNHQLRYKLLGHGHPKAYGYLATRYDQWGIAHTPSFDEVMRRAGVYVCDNSSTIYEFAAQNRPVVVMNPPQYRRNVHHGLRFWENIPGIQVDRWEDLNAAIYEALYRDTWAAERQRITDIVYPYLGQATYRAARAIESIL